MPDRYFRRQAFGRLAMFEVITMLFFWPFEKGIPRLWRHLRKKHG